METRWCLRSFWLWIYLFGHSLQMNLLGDRPASRSSASCPGVASGWRSSSSVGTKPSSSRSSASSLTFAYLCYILLSILPFNRIFFLKYNNSNYHLKIQIICARLYSGRNPFQCHHPRRIRQIRSGQFVLDPMVNKFSLVLLISFSSTRQRLESC
jgi:hypothetical protein